MYLRPFQVRNRALLVSAKCPEDASFVSQPTQFSADFDIDGLVGDSDLAIWEQNYGATNVPFTSGDADGDHIVDGLDFLRWQRQHTGAIFVSSSQIGVPEPNDSSLVTLAFVLVGLTVRVKP